MLFQSSIRKELAATFGATLVVLLTIVMTIVLIRTLGQASRGYISPQDVLLFMAYSALGRLPTLLTLSLFIAMVSTLARMYRDSEMVIWFTSGQGLFGFLGPLFRFAWPVLLIVILAALWVWPWTNQQTKDMQQRYEQRGDLERIAPGQFQESSSGRRVFFIDRDLDSLQSDGTQPQANSIFISATDKGKNSVTTAKAGHVETQENAQFLILQNGQRLENVIGQSALKVIEFESYGTRTGDSPVLGETVAEAKLLAPRTLLKAPTRANQSELAWRVGLGLAAVNLILLALALARVNPRAGSSSNLILGLLSFVAYNNFMTLGQSWIFLGRISFSAFLWLMHGGIFVLAVLWLSKRHYHWRWQLLPPWRSRTAVPRTLELQP